MNLSNLSSNKLSWLFLYLFTLQRTLLHLPVLVHEPVKLIIQQAQLVVPPYAAAGHTVVCKLGSSLLPTPTLKARNIIILLILTSATTTAEITISLAASSAAAKWNVLTRQIPCDPTYMAPTDCTQYLTGITGSISTYGYNSGIITTENLQSLDYKVCIRREDGYCSIRHSACSSTSFDLSAIANADTAIGVRGAVGCYADFIQIPGGSLDGTGTTYDRYCGGKLTHIAGPVSQAIISKSVPFEVYVHTDVTDTPSATPYGVCLNYQQLPC